jgi:hypothetical protein
MTPYDFLLDSYETERLKTLTVWSQFADAELPYRPAPLARTPHEHMVRHYATTSERRLALLRQHREEWFGGLTH